MNSFYAEFCSRPSTLGGSLQEGGMSSFINKEIEGDRYARDEHRPDDISDNTSLLDDDASYAATSFHCRHCKPTYKCFTKLFGMEE